MSNDIWIPRLCGNISEYDAFWSVQLTVNTSNPDLTRCFQSIVFPGASFALMLFGGVTLLIQYSFKESVFTWRQKSKLNLSKVILSSCVWLCVLIALFNDAGAVLFGPGKVVPIAIISTLVQLLSFGLATCLIHVEYKKAVHTSGLQQCYWTTVVICSITSVRSSYLQAERHAASAQYTEPGIQYISLILTATIWILSFFPDTSVLRNRSECDAERIPLLREYSEKSKIPEEKKVKPCPVTYVSFLVDVTYTWFCRYVIDGWKQPLTFEDLSDLMSEDKCEYLVPKFYSHWHKELELCNYSLTRKSETQYTNKRNNGNSKGNPSLVKALVLTELWKLCLCVAVRVVGVSLTFLNPLLLRLLLTYIESGEPYLWKGILMALTMLSITTASSLLVNRAVMVGLIIGMNLRTIVTAAVYRKSLKLSNAAKKEITMGEITNLMSVDAQKLQDAMLATPTIWVIPITVSICSVLLFRTVGYSGLCGVSILVVIIPSIGWYCSNKIRQLQDVQMTWKDKRVRTVNEILTGIKVLKLYSWENPFKEKVKQFRDEEVNRIKKVNVLDGLSFSLWCNSTYLVLFVIFVVFLWSSPGNVLDPGRVFVTFALVNILNFPLTILPLGVNYAGQVYVAVKRIRHFLLLEETQEDAITPNNDCAYSVQIRDGSFSWGSERKPVLKNINFAASPGELVGIVGQVGSGKSSLVSSLLGEMVKVKGDVHVNGSLSYVPQHAWILNTSVKNNILFGKEKIETNYQRVLNSCALRPDLKILSDGDLTEIGEKGINLSGGQKQRVSLARAVYQDTDIYLLDDPLSAVDAHVAKELFNGVIGPRGMLKNKTRILITHSVTFLPYVDKILVMRNGEIAKIGSYENLLKEESFFADFLMNYVAEGDHSALTESGKSELSESLTSIHSGTVKNVTKASKGGKRKQNNAWHMISTESHAMKNENDDAAPLKLITAERESTGHIKSEVIKSYAMAGGKLQIAMVGICNVCFLACLIYGQIWLSKWSTDPQDLEKAEQTKLTQYRLSVYGGIIGAQVFFLLTASIALAIGCALATQAFHSRIITRLLRAPMAFFDTTPLGRVMNRCSKDVDVLDVNVPIYLRILLLQFNPLLAAIVIVTYSTPIFLVVVVPVACFYILTQRIYINTARQLRRIDSVRKSPVFSHYEESVAGATSIRAYQKVNEFIATCDRLTDESQRAWFLLNISQRWMGVTLEFLGALVAFSAACLAIFQRFEIGPGVAGLSVSFSLQISMYLNYFVRAATELETYMVAAERVKEYSEIPIEADYEIAETQPAVSWPDEGRVVYKSYSTRYRPELDLVLKDISFTISGAEKVGVVGRTGAGKSSVALSLFRIIESSGGSIYIDGLPIASLGLHDLRSKLTIIPQDPVVFSGTLRFNIDPVGTATDSQLWRSAEQAHLKPFILATQEGLDYECGENGERLSVGQRQLVCLARALLRKSKILLLDEATSGVDLETDDLIQDTIRSAFYECTVITIAHRINTILDYDKVMVLDEGRVVEFDTPSALLEDKDSVFRALATNTNMPLKKTT